MAHVAGFRGHFASKSRRYFTTPGDVHRQAVAGKRHSGLLAVTEPEVLRGLGGVLGAATRSGVSSPAAPPSTA